MRQLPIRLKLLLTCGALACAASASHAQEKSIQWRTDYHAARKEAEQKKRPIFIDFWKVGCPPCQRMDESTFRDARIVAMLNEKYIPLKINGPESSELTAALRIYLYPSIIMATSEGRIVTETPLEGYKDADLLHDHLQRLLATLTPSDGMKRDYDNALKWETSGDYPRAIAALRGILDDGKGGTIQKNAQELLQKIEKRAEQQLSRAKELQDKGNNAEALDTLTDLLRKYPGVQASKDASDLIGKLVQDNAPLKAEFRTKRAADLLSQAREFYKTKDYIPCLDRCELLLANFGDLPEGQQAFALVAEIKNNPEWLQNAADVMSDRLGGVYLALADSYLKRGDVAKAEFYLKRVLQAFPGSRLAESAQIRLTQLQATAPKVDPMRAGP